MTVYHVIHSVYHGVIRQHVLQALQIGLSVVHKYTCHPLAAAAQQRGSIAAAAAVASVTGLAPMSSVPISSAMGVAIHTAAG